MFDSERARNRKIVHLIGGQLIYRDKLNDPINFCDLPLDGTVVLRQNFLTLRVGLMEFLP